MKILVADDDDLTEPFRMRMLVAKVRALLQRPDRQD